MLAFNLDRVEVEAIACPVEAVQRVQGAQHDLVICDLAMPRMDGIAVLKHLQISSPATVCILMTGHWDKEIQMKAQQAGAFACVPKPLERKTLLGTIRHALATALRPDPTGDNAVPDSNVSTP
ncbi:MAG: response regulator [Nitrospirota bacterium]|nr:response regulator [Nitrospirota bacterium]